LVPNLRILLICWVVPTLTIVFLGVAVNSYRAKKLWVITLADFLSLSSSVAAIVSGGNLIYRTIFSQEIINVLGFDIWILVIGIFSIFWLAFKEIWRIFKDI
jgi:hypothetical protein